eukprot:6772728-Alexandrium_andersonii.AAC.1
MDPPSQLQRRPIPPRSHLGVSREVEGYAPRAEVEGQLLRVDTAGNIQRCREIPQSCIVGWREYLGNGHWMAAELKPNMGQPD